MPDWQRFVRARLHLPDLTPERESRIVRELAAHLEDFYRDARARGLDDEAAEAYASNQITDWPALVNDVCRADRPHVRPAVDRFVATIEQQSTPARGGVLMLAHVLRDARFALRQLIKAPAFTIVALLTLALGTGATTAMFSVVNGVLLRPLPYAQPSALVRVHEIVPDYGRYTVAPATFLDWRAQNTAFERLAAYSTTSATLMSGGAPERVTGAVVSWNMFELLRVAPFMGGAFTASQDAPGAPPTIVLSHSAWLHRFNADPAIVGNPVSVNGRPTIVAGVMPEDFYFPTRTAEFWLPLALPASGATRGGHYLSVIGRTKDGVSLEATNKEMRAISERLAKEYPAASAGESAEVVLLQEQIVGAIRPALLTLFAAVAVVVLIACANVANLLLVRASVREREMSIRAALGASRARIAGQLIAESVVLAVSGGALGLLLAYAALGPIHTLGAGSIPRVADVGIDARVMAFTALASIVTALLFGLAPAWHASRPGIGAMLKEGGRGSATASGRWLRRTLLVAEVALSMVLLVGAALLLRSFMNVTGINPGFDADRVLAFQLSLPARDYPDQAKIGAFYDTLLESLQTQPGVRSAGLTQTLPMRGSYNLTVEFRGQPKPKDGESPSADYRSISAGYLQTLGVTLRKGRLLAPEDARAKRMVAVIDEAFASKYFKNADPIGQGLNIGNGTDGYYDVVGVVSNIHSASLESAASPSMYVPFTTDGFSSVWLVMRADGDPSLLAPSARKVVHDLDPALPAYAISPLATIVSDSLGQRRFSTLLIGVFAVLALFLAAVGLYGVVSYTVSQRTREIGLRMALGARPSSVVLMILGGGLALVAIGVGLGLVASIGLTRLVRAMLFDVTPFDLTSYAITAGILLLVAVVACLIPARRAMRVDPIVAMAGD